MKFIYYLAAIGTPDIETKINILQHNLEYIYKNINEKYDIIINCYNSYEIIKKTIQDIKFLNNKYFYNKEGILTELWLTNPYNDKLNEYEYILFILDDVRIDNMDINNMIEIKKKYNIEILSPKIINSTHKYMNEYNNITIHNFLEIYCLLLCPIDFIKYSLMNTIENKWMWGPDLLFGHYKIYACVNNNYSATHMIPSKSNKEEAYKLMNKYFTQKRFTLDYINKTYMPVKNILL